MDIFNPRDYTTDKHRTVDDRPYGGGPGMLMMVQPLTDAISGMLKRLREVKHKFGCVPLTPQGQTLDQAGVRFSL